MKTGPFGNLLTLFLILFTSLASHAWAAANYIWVEGEKPAVNKMNRHPWWYDQVKRDQFSGGDFISNFNQDKAGEADYRFSAASAGEYEFWVRANPLMAKLSYSLNGAAETAIDLTAEKRGEVNVAADGKPDLRFIAWCKVGKVTLRAGENTIKFRMTSANNNHGYLDCFVFSAEPFQPRGILKPDQLAADAARMAEENKGWFLFDPKPDTYAESLIDLRFLNEKFAGELGWIGTRNGQFIHSANGQPVRFWAVNGPSGETKDRAQLRQTARMLAKHGVNLVRRHGAVFDKDGELNPAAVQRAIAIVEEMKAEGIYTHFSIYFPLWFTPRKDHPWMEGYDGQKHPFAALMFNPKFQAKYREWLKALLTTPSEKTGKPLTEDPALFGIEIQNEDSFFFWTFSTDGLPDAQLRILETQFADWLKKKYGSLDAAFTAWKGQKVKRDAPAENRVSFRPLWNIFSEKSARDRDTAAFLFEVQSRFYSETYAYLRQLGFKGLVTPSNWATASPEVFGPLEKLTYTTGDFIDRHGYFECNHKGDNAAWSVRNGHTYNDRSALRFEADDVTKARQFVHPIMDPHYAGKPSMISETTFCRPNRYRSEAPLYFAAYGALQNSDCIVHFALDSGTWAVKPGFFMQQWTLMTPVMMGQFPAAALIYRRGLVSPGKVLAEINLNKTDLLNLKGTPLPQDASLDELRLADVPKGADLKPGQRIDPLIHYAGQVSVNFVTEPGSTKVSDLSSLIDHNKKSVTSSTGELNLNYDKGILTINAAQAQGVSGALKTAGATDLKDVSITSELELGQIVAVALDDQPLATSSRILLQVMSEEKASNFQTELVSASVKRITNIGTDPWQVKELKGTVKLKRPDAAQLKVTALDFNGYPAQSLGTAQEIQLKRNTVYYLISR